MEAWTHAPWAREFVCFCTDDLQHPVLNHKNPLSPSRARACMCMCVCDGRVSLYPFRNPTVPYRRPQLSAGRGHLCDWRVTCSCRESIAREFTISQVGQKDYTVEYNASTSTFKLWLTVRAQPQNRPAGSGLRVGRRTRSPALASNGGYDGFHNGSPSRARAHHSFRVPGNRNLTKTVPSKTRHPPHGRCSSSYITPETLQRCAAALSRERRRILPRLTPSFVARCTCTCDRCPRRPS